MKTAVWTRCVALSLLAFAAMAQTSNSQNNGQPDSGLKVLSFGFSTKTSSQLELVAVPNNPAVRPTATATMGAEYSREPTGNSQYYQYEKRTNRLPYANLRVKNEGAKAIRSVVWEFTDPHFKGEKEIGYSEAKTKLKMAPGQSAALTVRVPDYRGCGSAMRVERGVAYIAGMCGRETRKSTRFYRVEAKLKQINYEDGSAWKAN